MTMLTIDFDARMPATSLDVLDPDLAVVKRIMLVGGARAQVEVERWPCSLQLHMANGSSIVLPDLGEGKWTISPDSLHKLTHKRVPLKAPEQARQSCCGPVQSSDRPLPPGMRLLQHGTPLAGRMTPVTAWANWPLDGVSGRSLSPLSLQVEIASGLRCEVQIPGSATEVWTRLNAGRTTLDVRLTTSSQVADTIASYVQQGKLYSAETMGAWFNHISRHRSEPYVLCVGGYLQLRLHQQTELAHWIGGLVDDYPSLPDARIIRAWHLINGLEHVDESQVHADLLAAASRGLPVFTEGLRLLLDGLQMVDRLGYAVRDKVLAAAGNVVWSAPLTTSLFWSGGSTGVPSVAPAVTVKYGEPA